jgi:hypothetical protein
MNVHCFRCDNHIGYGEGIASISHYIQQFNHDETVSVIYSDSFVHLCHECAADLDVQALGEDLKRGVHRLPEGPWVEDRRPEASTIWRSAVPA